MSTSLIYHAMGLQDYAYVQQKFAGGSVILRVKPRWRLLRCPACKSKRVVRRGQCLRKLLKNPENHSPERNEEARLQEALKLNEPLATARSLELARIIVAYWDPFTQFQLILPCFLPASFVVQQWKYCVVPFWNIG